MKRRWLPLLILAAIASMGVGEGIGEWRPPDAGGGSGFPGVSGSTGNDDTLDALYSLTNLPLYPEGPVYYFSCATTGQITATCSSTGKGTIEEPLCDWVDAEPVIRDGVTLRFDDEDTCFDYASTDQTDHPVDAPFGDWRPVLRIDSTRPGHRFLLTQTTEPPIILHVTNRGASGFELAGGTVVLQDILLSGSTNLGFVVDDGVRMVTQNVYSSSDVASNGYTTYPVGNSKVLNLNGGGVGQDSPLIGGNQLADSTYITKGTYRLANSGSVASFSGSSAIGFGENITLNSPLRVNIVGATLSTGAVAAGIGVNLQAVSGIDGETWIEANLARVTIFGQTFNSGSSSAVTVNEQATRRTVVRAYQSTFSEMRRVFSLTGTDTAAVEAGSKMIGMYNVYQLGSTTTNLWIQSTHALSLQPLAEILFSDSFVHQQNSPANLFIVEAADGTSMSGPTVAGMRSDIAGSGAATIALFANFFADASTLVSSATLPTDDQFAGSGYRCTDTLGTGGTPCATPATDAVGGTADGFCDNAATYECARLTETASCDMTEECGTAPTGAETYDVPVWIPGAVVGSTQDITSLRLTVDHYGAH